MSDYTSSMYGGAPDECNTHWPQKYDECICAVVKAVREHPKLGRGSCHPWDECYTDEELREMLDGKTVEDAISLGLAVLDVFDDRIADARNSAF